jgi:hypothetical protein
VERCGPEVLTHTLGSINEFSSQISKNSIRLFLVCIQAATGDKEIQPTVIVQIHQPASPPTPWKAQLQQTRRRASIYEGAVTAIQK